MRLRGITLGLLAVALATGQAPNHAAVVAEDGGLGVYDSTNSVTWVSSGDLFGSQYSTSAVNTIGSDANSANAWVRYLDATSFGGSSQWTLPTTVDDSSGNGYPNGLSGSTGFVPNVSVSSSEMAELFYGQPGQVMGSSITTTNSGTGGYALFNNLQNYAYGSGTPLSTASGLAWDFNTTVGSQGGDGTARNYYALAVSPDQVPEPATLSLFGLGLAAVGFIRRRKAS